MSDRGRGRKVRTAGFNRPMELNSLIQLHMDEEASILGVAPSLRVDS
jgi:hypothetical protein